MAFKGALLFLVSMLVAVPAAAGIDRPERAEVIEEVSRFTGLGKDAVSLVFNENPDLLAGMDEAVFAVKVINSFCEARDTEALADLQDYALGKAIDKMKDKLLPQAMNGFLLAFGVYKTSLEAMRDYYYIPTFDSKIYQAYRAARLEDLRRGDTSFESKQTAFSKATTQKSSGYFVVKDQMYEKMIKAKNYQKEHIGEKLERKLRSQIDDFWRDRLELKLQQEQLQAGRNEMIAALWQNRSAQVDALRAKAGRAAGPEGFFITQRDLPPGWKLNVREKTKPEEMTPRKRTDGAYAQTIKLTPTGHAEKDGRYYDSTGKKILTFMHNSVSVAIAPAVQSSPTGYVFSFKEQVKENIRKNKSDYVAAARILGTWTENGVEAGYLALEDQADFRRGDRYVAVFIKGNWYVTIEIYGFSLRDLERLAQDEEARSKGRGSTYILKTPASEETLVHLARAIAGKIR